MPTTLTIPLALILFIRTVLLINLSFLVFVFTDTYTQTSLAWTAIIFCLFIILAYVSAYYHEKIVLTTYQLIFVLIVPIVGALVFSASQGGPSLQTFLYLTFGGLYLLIWSGAYRSKNTMQTALWMLPVQTAISFAIAGFESLPLIIVSIGLIGIALAECHVSAFLARVDMQYRGIFFVLAVLLPFIPYAIFTRDAAHIPVAIVYVGVIMLGNLFYNTLKGKPLGYDFSGIRMVWIGVLTTSTSLLLVFAFGKDYRIAVYFALCLTIVGAFYLYGWLLRGSAPRKV